MLFAIGFWNVKEFYWVRVGGNYNYAEGIDLFTSRLQINPPNLSVILYSVGCIYLFYVFFSLIETYGSSWIKKSTYPITLLGKYSLDIYIWHLFVQKILIMRISNIGNMGIKRIIFYLAMFLGPILGRIIYERIKKEVKMCMYSRDLC